MRLRLIQAGVGGFGAYWLDNVLRARQYRLVAVVDPRQERLALARDKANLPSNCCFSSLRDALRDVEADVLLNVTPVGAHRETTELALRAGLHVLVEKPMAESMADARAMVRAAKRAARLLMVTQQYRYHPYPRAIRQAIEAGRIGRLDHVMVEYQMPLQVGGWRRDMAQPFLVDMAIHHFDLLRYLTTADAEQVYAQVWNPEISTSHGPMHAMAIFQMSGGVRANYTGGWASPGRDTGWNGNWVLTGNKGCIVWTQEGATLHLQDIGTGTWNKPTTVRNLRPARMKATGSDQNLLHLADCIRTGCEPLTSGRDNLGTLAMVFGCVRSGAKNRPVACKP